MPEKLRIFLFEHIDSVELIEVLLFLRSQRDTPDMWKSADEVSQELRSNTNSVGSRLTALRSLRLAEEDSQQPGKYRFEPQSPELIELVDLLAQEYKLRRHRVMEVVFSSAKKARDFADAFVLHRDPRKKGESDG